MDNTPLIQPDLEPTTSRENLPTELPLNETPPQWEDKSGNGFDRTLWYTIGGIVLISCCGILLLGYLFTRTPAFKNATTIFTPAPTYTPAPTPNMPATQTAWIKPAQSPTLGSADEAQAYIDADNTIYLTGFRLYASPRVEVNQPGDVYYYDIFLPTSTRAIWSYGWCTLTPEILDQNFDQMKVEFLLNGNLVDKTHITHYDHQEAKDRFCRTYAIIVTKWPAGIHKLDSNVTFLKPTDDGWNIYPAGMHTFRYFVNLQP